MTVGESSRPRSSTPTTAAPTTGAAGPGASPRTTEPAHPVRPPWRDFFLLHRLLTRDLLGGLVTVHQRYGAFVRTRLPLHIYFVADPACIEEILVKKAEHFGKDRTSRL